MYNLRGSKLVRIDLNNEEFLPLMRYLRIANVLMLDVALLLSKKIFDENKKEIG